MECGREGEKGRGKEGGNMDLINIMTTEETYRRKTEPAQPVMLQWVALPLVS